MEIITLSLSPFIELVGVSVILLLFHVMLQAALATREKGIAWNAGARDAGNNVTGIITGRADRALNNFKETYPAFVALALSLAIANHTSGLGLNGAWVWLVCRIVYIPLYLAGIPFVRSLVWAGSIVGLLMMLAALFA